MKLLRPLLFVAAAVLVVAVIAIAVVLTPDFQTWIVRRELARRPDLHLTVRNVAASIGGVTLVDVNYVRDGVRVSVPRLDADLPVLSAVFSRQVVIGNLRANGVSVDASGYGRTAGEAVAAAPGNAAPAGSIPTSTFAGILPELTLPFDLAVGRLEVSGDVQLPAKAGTLHIQLSGGGLGAGQQGKLDVVATATLPGTTVTALQASGQVLVAMDSPRTFSRLAAALAAKAAGKTGGAPVQLKADFAAARNSDGEQYSLILTKGDRPLLNVDAKLPNAGGQLTGKWKLDFHDTDVAPFALGHALPSFVGVGEGTVDTDLSFSAIHVVGRIDARVDRLETLGAKLRDIGAVQVTADVDGWQRGNVFSVAKLTVDVAAPGPHAAGEARRVVARVRALQAFEFNPKTGDLHATNPATDLLGIVLEGVPLGWARPFFSSYELSGSDVRGELVATPRAGGFTARTVAALSVRQLSVAAAGRPWLHELDVSLNGAGDYTPLGWQAEVSGLTAKAGHSTVLLLDAKAGQLAGDGQPVKATGLVSVDLAALGAQPAIAGAIPLRRGEATVEFAGSFGPTKQIQAKVTLTHLVADPSATTEALADVSATVRADIAEDGRVAVNVPINFQREDRQSDLTFIGSFGPRHSGRGFEAQVSSNRLVVDDIKPFAAIWRPGSQAPASSAPAARAPWAGLNGTIALQLKQLSYSGAVDVTNIVGQLRITGGTLNFENVHAGVGEGGDALVNGRIGFDTERKQYAAQGHLVLVDFNPAPIFRARSKRLPIVEGKFGLSSDVSAQAATLESLPVAAAGSFELTSRGGTFRALQVDVGNLVENSGKLRAWLAAAGTSIGNTIAGWAGRKEDYDEITSRSQAANELAKALSAIAYDQLNIVATRDDALNANVKQFALISPEFRITGHGQTIHAAGQPIREDQIALELQLRARGRAADLMKYLGVLDPKPDDLGYSACTIPIKVTGTVANLDARDFSNRLIALAVEKTGILERAGARALDWINRLRGKG